MLSHMVYFTLKDSSESAQQTMVDACNKFLKPLGGITFFAAGKHAPEFDRPVNDHDFHIALHVIFDTKESHDVYQVAPEHLEFIAQGKDNWEQVRIFDAYVD